MSDDGGANYSAFFLIMNKVALHTLGCKLNFSETSALGKQFTNKGFEIVNFNSYADIYVINTCTVTENADKECRQIIRRALRKNPEAYIIVTGCYAQLKPEEIAGIGGVDLVLGSQEKFDLFTFAKEFKKETLACIYVTPHNNINQFGFAYSSDADSRTRAYFKIQDGCDYKCSFCTIPLARGASRSLDSEKLYSQFNQILEQGYKEVIITGVNVGDYGVSSDIKLLNILQRLVQIEGDFRIRISSIEPNLLNDDLIDLAATNSKLCKHFHIPLQSGSNKILRLMKRRYSTSDYKKLIFKLKEKIPNVGIGVDVIVGFPGELESDFYDTYNFVNEIPISYLHVFTYSERESTAAVKLDNPVQVMERRRRNSLLRNLSELKRNSFLSSMEEKTLQVLFEQNNEEGIMKGYSSNYVRVHHPFNNKFVNKLINFKITFAKSDHCIGEILEQKK
jgi:threonylcarbamoyladenosine tRNA methylthiotransferase MtaB